MPRHSAENINYAFDFARSKGKSLNKFCTITFHDFDHLDASNAFSKIRNSFRDWLSNGCKRYHLDKQKPYWVYVFENTNNLLHVHWCLYIPIELEKEFVSKVDRWVNKWHPYRDGTTVNIKNIDMTKYKTLANYLIKSVNDLTSEYFNLPRCYDYQGIIECRRSFVSHALGRTAIRRENYKPWRDRLTYKANNQFIKPKPRLLNCYKYNQNLRSGIQRTSAQF